MSQTQRDAFRQPTEGGLRNHRCEFVREEQQGQAPSDPEYLLYSDTMADIFNWQPDTNMEAGRGVGDRDPNGHYQGAESHEITFNYWMQNWFVDENGEALSAGYDAIMRTAGGLVPHTHTIVDREEHTTGGADGAGLHIYTVAEGAMPSSFEPEGDASEGTPIPVEMAYQAEKVRSYAISQPSAETPLVVASTDDADDAQVSIEDDGANTTEQVQLNGTTPVAVAGPFGSIDAIRLDGQCVGNVEVSIDTGADGAPTVGTTLATIYGKRHYSQPGATNLAGDLGVPLLGAGSHAEPIGTGYEYFIGQGRLVRQGGLAGPEPRVNTSGFSVDNNIETNEEQFSRVMAIDEGIRDSEVTASVAGPKATHKATTDHLAATKGDFVWGFASGGIRFVDATVTEPGERTPESEQAAAYIDDTFGGEGVELLSSQEVNDLLANAA